MSLSTNVQDLATRVSTEVKLVKTLINGNQGDLTALQTTAKTNLVAAINELVAAIGGAGASIDDENVSTVTVYSSDKTVKVVEAAVAALVDAAPETLDTLAEIAEALGDDPNFATTITNLIGTKADDSVVVKTSGNQTVAGVKTFSSAPVVPDNSFAISKTNGLQTALDGKAASAHVHSAANITSGTLAAARLPSASETASGIVELATPVEVTTGTDESRAVTPAGMKTVTDTLATKDAMGDPDTDFVATFEAGLT